LIDSVLPQLHNGDHFYIPKSENHYFMDSEGVSMGPNESLECKHPDDVWFDKSKNDAPHTNKAKAKRRLCCINGRVFCTGACLCSTMANGLQQGGGDKNKNKKRRIS
jgi:hypothetical protein